MVIVLEKMLTLAKSNGNFTKCFEGHVHQVPYFHGVARWRRPTAAGQLEHQMFLKNSTGALRNTLVKPEGV